MRDRLLIRTLANSLLAGEPSEEEIAARLGRTFGKPWRWIGPLARRYAAAVSGRTRPSLQDVVLFLRQDWAFQHVYFSHGGALAIEQWLPGPQKMLPVAAARDWDIPAIESPGTLAEWLRLTPGELEWFADLRGLEGRKDRPKLRHYRYSVLTKRSGGVRLIEAPKPRLKEVQRRILSDILNKIPPHPAAHGFLAGRSIKTFAAPHVDRRVVLRMDLCDFFPSFAAARVQAFFRTIGYPDSVASLLCGVCTNAVPRDVWDSSTLELSAAQRRQARDLYSRPHLPQGAPSSPALANLCAHRLDCRLAALAGGTGAQYTRYADDLAFSGNEEFERCVERFSTHVAAVLLEEGFSAQHQRRASCGRECGSAWRAWWPIGT